MRRRRLRYAAGTLGAALLVGAAAPRVRTAAVHVATVLFETSDRCMACHIGVTTSSGQDVSIGFQWRPSMMANSARDPYWQAGVRREVTDHPTDSLAIQDECTRCHMPMARLTAVAAGGQGRVFANLPAGSVPGDEARLADDGVSCSICHQIRAEGLGTPQGESGRFQVDTVMPADSRVVYGPFTTDSGRSRVMHSASSFIPTEGRHIQSAEFCADCHTLRTHSLGAGTGSSLPEQTPYLEWRASAYASSRPCQSCHMPEVAEDVPVTGVLGQARSHVSQHVFRGGNFFMLQQLERHRVELGVVALPQELDLEIARSLDFLQTRTARLEVNDARVAEGRLRADVVVANLAGHKFPSAYPSRRAWLHVTVRDSMGAVVFESGAFAANGSVVGNDEDRDASAYEPHHDTIDRPDEVQVYQSVMADPQGRPTTGLLTAVRYVKDNRLLPAGFDAAAGGADVAVRGAAERDGNFTGGGDRVRYSVDVSGRAGPFRVDAELWYQPVSYRWARNLAAYDTPETRRIVGWFDEMAPHSAVVVARAGVGGVR